MCLAKRGTPRRNKAQLLSCMCLRARWRPHLKLIAYPSIFLLSLSANPFPSAPKNLPYFVIARPCRTHSVSLRQRRGPRRHRPIALDPVPDLPPPAQRRSSSRIAAARLFFSTVGRQLGCGSPDDAAPYHPERVSTAENGPGGSAGTCAYRTVARPETHLAAARTSWTPQAVASSFSIRPPFAYETRF
jgi:hypothetical protein